MSQAVNIEYLNKQSPYVKQENDPAEKDQKKFWIGPNNCLSAYDPVKKWNSVFAEVGLILKSIEFLIQRNQLNQMIILTSLNLLVNVRYLY